MSLSAELVVEAQDGVGALVRDSKCTEFKWSSLKDARHRFCAIKLIDYFLDHMLSGGARVDVLTWDTHDSRHNVRRRDDLKNFERMYYHLHTNVMRRREPGALWHLRPDERLGIDWGTTESCLKATGKWPRHLQDLFGSAPSSYWLKTFREVKSHKQPLCQLADLFAGMAPYSRENARLIRQDMRRHPQQASMFPEGDGPKRSNADEQRLEVLRHLYESCKKRKLGVSLDTEGYLLTHHSKYPLNFWHYRPQHDADRAPTRDG